MKTLLAVVITLLAALPLAAQNPDSRDDQAEEERIRSFDSRITVNDDGSLRVRETIVVQATGEAIHHGITRDFPTHYKLRGFNYSVGFEIESVQRDGKDEPY